MGGWWLKKKKHGNIAFESIIGIRKLMLYPSKWENTFILYFLLSSENLKNHVARPSAKRSLKYRADTTDDPFDYGNFHCIIYFGTETGKFPLMSRMRRVAFVSSCWCFCLPTWLYLPHTNTIKNPISENIIVLYMGNFNTTEEFISSEVLKSVYQLQVT